MQKETVIIALGLIVVLDPFLGLPNSWDTIILVFAGLAILGIAFYARWEKKQEGQYEMQSSMTESYEGERA